MRILIVNTGILPVKLYGGTERVIWALGKELVKLGHEVIFMVKEGSSCDFAKILPIQNDKPLVEQIPGNIDVVHFNFKPPGLKQLQVPYLITIHGNSNNLLELDKNTVFVSKNHALRYNSHSYIHNGLDWDEYTPPDFNLKRKYFHFLGNAAWRVKNVKGAIEVIKQTQSEKLKVLGGVRFNFKMGIRLTFSPKVSFYGLVGGKEKDKLINGSKGLLFPVKWHEPFGLAIIESLYYGCPIFSTPYGSLPELVKDEVGFLSNSKKELVEAISNPGIFSPRICHEYAVEEFNSKKMALAYLERYQDVIEGKFLNESPPKLKTVQEQKFLAWNK